MSEDITNAESQEASLAPTDEDVEAHGLKEVAAGIGAAAIIGGGVAAVVAQTEAGSVASPQAAITLTPEAQQLAASTTDAAGNLIANAGGAVETATGTVQSAADQAAHVADGAGTSIAGVTVTGHDAQIDLTVGGTTVGVSTDALETVGGVAGAAGATAHHATQKVADTVEHTTGTVKADVHKVVDGVKADVHKTVAGVDATVHKTVADATKTVAGAEHAVNKAVAIHVVSSTKTLEGWVMGIKVMGLEVATPQAHLLSPTGLVTVTDAHGKVVASATLANGAANINIAGAHAGTSYTVHYPGDAGHGATTVNWVVPV